MVLLTALAGLALGRLDAKIDLVCAGADAPRVVADLAKVAGVKLTAPAVFKRDIIILSVHQAPLKSVMDRVADLCAAEWKSDETGFQLVVSAEKRRAEEAQEREALRAAYARGIEGEKKKAAALPVWSLDYAKATRSAFEQLDPTNPIPDDNVVDRYDILSARSPAGRGLTRLFATLDPGFLADHWRQETVVFSTQPTRMQFPMPSGAAPALAALRREAADWAAIEPRDQDARRQYDGRGKTLLILHLGASRSTGQVRGDLLMVNDHGFAVQFAQRWFEASLPVPTSQTPSGREAPLDPGPYGRWLGEAHFGDSLSAALVDPILHPESREPLSLMVGPILIQCADAHHENLIASAPDSLASIGGWVARTKATPRAFVAAFNGKELSISEDDGWMTVGSQFPATARRERGDRPMTGAFIRQAMNLGNDLDAWAGYAASVEGDLRFSIGYQWLRITAPTALTAEDGLTLKFYGQLGRPARDALANGPVLLASLSRDARATLDLIVYGEGAIDGPTSSFGDYPDLMTLPSEALPTGFPADSTLVLGNRSATVLIAPPYTAADGSRHEGRAIGFADVAEMKYRVDHPNAPGGPAPDPDFNKRKFGLTSREYLTLKFDFSQERWMTRLLRSVKPATKTISYDEAPPEFRRQVEEVLAKLRNGG